jgi:hypothetical protein
MQTPNQKDHLPHFQTLVRNNGLPQNKEASACSGELGYKSILTTMIYTHLINFQANAYHSDVAQTVEEARKLIEAGFEYVTGEYDDGEKSSGNLSEG